jgi:putative methionine-R-sulfoxide reductase with GAF domain
MQTAQYKQQILDWVATQQPQLNWQYQVPLLGEGGTCSLFGELDDTPFDLNSVLNAAEKEYVSPVQAIVDWVHENTDVDWFGVYLKRQSEAEGQVLTKLAYFGAPSRAEFPLNQEFAALSNNSTVGLTGEKRLINSVTEYRQQGGEYYTCDPKVNSELCWPIFSTKNDGQLQQDQEILGIIDAECFAENKFDLQAQQKFEAVCEVLAEILTTSN